MVRLRGKTRDALPDSAFAYVDAAGRRRLPIHDERHVRNALARFDRVVFDDEAERDRARRRLLRAARRHGIVTDGFLAGQLDPTRRLPTGRVTLLMTDLEGSSTLLAELGDRYAATLAAVRRIQRAALRRTGGREVDVRADELLAAFATTEPAVTAAIAIQRAMADHDWPDGRQVRLRIAVHAGRPTLTAAGYVGLAVNTLARVCAATHGGQVTVTAAAAEALAAGGAIGADLEPLGRHRFRGIPDATELFELACDGLAGPFGTLREGGG